MTLRQSFVGTPSVKKQDWEVITPNGKIFGKRWSARTGDGRREVPILLFHHSLGCVELWRRFPADLASATGRTVVAYDRLGFGHSAVQTGKLPRDFIATEAASIVPVICERLGINNFITCGHSVGGAIAVETAAHFPDRCAAIVTIGAQAFVDDRIREGIRRAQRNFAIPENLAKLKKYHGERAEWIVHAWTETWLSSDYAGWCLEPSLAGIRCPVLAIHGNLDEYGLPEHAKRIAEGRGHAEILEGIGHAPHREAKMRVIDIVQRFLKTIEPA